MKEIENRFRPPLHDEWFTIQSGSIREIGSNVKNKNGNCRKDISFGHLASEMRGKIHANNVNNYKIK